MSVSSQLAFVWSAYGAAERAIRLADEKIGYLFLFLGILIATIGVRADTMLSLLMGPQYSPLVRGAFLVVCLVFLGAEGISLVYAVRSRRLELAPPADVSQVLAHLAAMETEGLAEELARALHQASDIAVRKLALLRISVGWAALAFLGWSVVLSMSVVF
jgi:hypothetical protein